MDRPIYAVGSVPRTQDMLGGERGTMKALGVMLQALLGNGTFVDGLACTPVAGQMEVQIGPGSIYSLSAVDQTPYSVLAADTTDEIIQQGLTWGETPLAITAPATVGDSQVFLVEAQFQQVDSSTVALQFYQSTNPTNPLAGYPAATIRKGVCALQVKAGVPAATGAQVAPTADAGWTPLWTVTVANGQTSIVQANIVLASGAPFIAAKIGGTFTPFYGDPNGFVAGTAGTAGQVFPSMVFDLKGSAWWVCTTTGTAATAIWEEIGQNGNWPFNAGVSTGTANAQTITLPASVEQFAAGDSFWFTVGVGLTNTAALYITIPAQGQFAGGTFQVMKDGPNGPAPLVGKEVVAGNSPMVKFDGTYLHLVATEMGTAAMANASSNTGTVAAVQGPVTSLALAQFSDTAGTVKTGPSLSSAQPVVMAASGSFVVGHAIVAGDTFGTGVDGGPLNAAVPPTPITAATNLVPGSYRCDTSLGAYTVTLIPTAVDGESWLFCDKPNGDQPGSWGVNNLTINLGGMTLVLPNGMTSNTTFTQDCSGEDFSLIYDATTGTLGIE